MMDYVRISQHENGHWMARVFWKRDVPPQDDDMPNHLKTFKPGETAYAAVNWAMDWYRHADVLIKCSSCNLPYKNGDACPAIRGGCPMGGDF